MAFLFIFHLEQLYLFFIVWCIFFNYLQNFSQQCTYTSLKNSHFLSCFLHYILPRRNSILIKISERPTFITTCVYTAVAITTNITWWWKKTTLCLVFAHQENFAKIKIISIFRKIAITTPKKSFYKNSWYLSIFSLKKSWGERAVLTKKCALNKKKTDFCCGASVGKFFLN